MARAARYRIKAAAIMILFLFLCAGCENAKFVTREELISLLPEVCKNKYQAYVTTKAVDDTLWVYLPYNSAGRMGDALTKINGKDLYLDFEMTCLNPYRVKDPAELKFLIQKVLKEVRGLLLRSSRPYKFFVLVASDVFSSINSTDQWFVGYFDDLDKYRVCLDFSGEGYSRLAWHREKIGFKVNERGDRVPKSFFDIEGSHVDYRDMTLEEFVDKQIVWRIYKRFTIDYYKVPFNLTRIEREDEVINIVKKVLAAYDFRGFDKLYLRDRSVAIDKAQIRTDTSSLRREVDRLNLDIDTADRLLEERMKRAGEDTPYHIGSLLEDIDKYRVSETKRKPAF
ncbi:MAG: hypothetical protein JW788_06850 [Candidatus Omnitrophica bacterium]|nr:hypothetical protein [Candidatus Omnitrophota bacterium]